MTESMPIQLRALGADDVDAVMRIQEHCYGADFAEYDDASVLYLHDMAVSEAAAGQGLARRMVQILKAQARARGVQRTALVSVQGSRLYWERQGYAVESVTNAAQQQHLASYGEGALYMVGFI